MITRYSLRIWCLGTEQNVAVAALSNFGQVWLLPVYVGVMVSKEMKSAQDNMRNRNAMVYGAICVGKRNH